MISTVSTGIEDVVGERGGEEGVQMITGSGTVRAGSISVHNHNRDGDYL